VNLSDLLQLGAVDSTLTGTVLILALAALGLAIGVISGIFGVSGGFLMTPMLAVLFGIDYTLAVGSGLCCFVGTSASGFVRHRRLGNVAAKTALYLATGSVIGVLLGDVLLDAMKIHFGDPYFTPVMHALNVVLLLTAAWLVQRRPAASHDGKHLLQRLPLGPSVDLQPNLRHFSASGLAAIGLFVGLLSGVLGTGGGVLIVPILIAVVGLTPHRAVGTSLGVILPTAIIGVAKKGLGDGKVSLVIAMSLLIGSTVGVQVGAFICQRLHAGRLRRYFVALVLISAAMVATELVGELIR